MRLSAFLIVILCIVNQGYTQGKFEISGKFTNLKKPVKAFASYRTNSGLKKDSSLVSNGEFSIKGEINKPVKAMFYFEEINPAVRYPKREYADLYIEPGKIKIVGADKLKSAHISGGKLQEEFNELQDSLEATNDLYDHINSLVKSRILDDTTSTRLWRYFKKINLMQDEIDGNPRSEQMAILPRLQDWNLD